MKVYCKRVPPVGATVILVCRWCRRRHEHGLQRGHEDPCMKGVVIDIGATTIKPPVVRIRPGRGTCNQCHTDLWEKTVRWGKDMRWVREFDEKEDKGRVRRRRHL